MSRRESIIFIAMLAVGVFAACCGWRSGEVQGYCEGRYGPGVEVVWTGALGITGECELAPAIPPKRETVP